jgi:hypothetical protein
MATFQYFRDFDPQEKENSGRIVIKESVEGDYMINPNGGESVQVFRFSQNTNVSDPMVAVFRLRSGEFVKQV